MAEYRLPEQKYTEAEYLFQTIEMAKSDEEYDVELCATPPPEIVDLELEPPVFSWKVVKRRQRQPHRRYTVSHSGGAPPAPPSTPTSLSASSGGTPTPSPTAASGSGAVAAATAMDDERLSSLLYILDYAPKYKKKLKEQQRTDAELAELFNVVTITGDTQSDTKSTTKLRPERGINAASRTIRKAKCSTKEFNIHRNPKKFFREPDEEDSISAPEYDTEEEDMCYRRFARLKPSRRLLHTKRNRRFARFEHQERMATMVDTFDAAMSFNDA